MEVGGRGESREEGTKDGGGWPRPESRCPQRLWPAAAALTGCRVEAEVGSAELLGDRGRRAARGWVGEGVE